MRLTDEQIKVFKEGKKHPGLYIYDLFDTIEALQQEINGWESRYAELDAGHSKLFEDFCGLKQEAERLQAQNAAMMGQPLFPNKLKEKCEQHGMTLRDVALKAGIAESTVYSLSACKVFPYPAWRQKIAKVFNCKESEIFAEVTND